MKTKQNLKIEGYTNKWSAIDETVYLGKKLYLMENCTYGDETQCLIVDGQNKVILDDVWNGFNDLEQIEIFYQ